MMCMRSVTRDEKAITWAYTYFLLTKEGEKKKVTRDIKQKRQATTMRNKKCDNL